MTIDSNNTVSQITDSSDQQPLKSKTTPASHAIPSTVTVITVEGADPDSSSGKLGKVIACVVGIILGAGMISLIGGFGTAGLFNNAGLAQYPQWLVNQINTIPNVYHNVMVGVGYIGGVIAIAISSIALYKILNPEAVEQSIGARKARLSENDVGTNVNNEVETSVNNEVGTSVNNKVETNLNNEVETIVNNDFVVNKKRAMTNAEENFFFYGRGARSDDFSKFYEDDELKELPAQWNKALVNKCTYFFLEAFDKGIVVIGRNGKGVMWFTENVFAKEGKDIKTLIRILEECRGYTRSQNQCPLEEIVMVNDDSASGSSSETYVNPNRVPNSDKSERRDSHAADSSQPEVEGPKPAVVEDPKLALVVPKIVVPAQQEKDSGALNEKEQAFMNSGKFDTTDEIHEFNPGYEHIPSGWKDQLRTNLTYVYEVYNDGTYDVIGRDEKGNMWNNVNDLSKDEKETFTAILKKHGYTPSLNQRKFKFD